MQNLFSRLYREEEGFIISAELILIATIVVLSMIVGLAEVGAAINNELTDVSQAFEAVNGSDRYDGYDNGDDSGSFGNNNGGNGNNGSSGGDIVAY